MSLMLLAIALFSVNLSQFLLALWRFWVATTGTLRAPFRSIDALCIAVAGPFGQKKQTSLHSKGHSIDWCTTANSRKLGPSNGSRIAGQSIWFRLTCEGCKHGWQNNGLVCATPPNRILLQSSVPYSTIPKTYDCKQFQHNEMIQQIQ